MDATYDFVNVAGVYSVLVLGILATVCIRGCIEDNSQLEKEKDELMNTIEELTHRLDEIEEYQEIEYDRLTQENEMLYKRIARLESRLRRVSRPIVENGSETDTED